MLEAKELRYAYRRRGGVDVVDQVTWKVRPGQVTLLLGPNGAGKSTLLKLMCGFLRPVSGDVLIDGENSARALRRKVGWMPQDIQPARG